MSQILLGTLAMGRAWAESTMTDSCVVTRAKGTVWDEDTGQQVPNIVTVYTGACKVRTPSAQVAEDSSNKLTAVSQHILSIPVESALLAADDEVTISASAGDPELVGEVLKVVAPFVASHATSRRYRCEVVSGRGH